MAVILRSGRTRPAISLTPLIDVVFILLVFFMLASSFLEWRALEIRLPGTETAQNRDETPMRIRLASDGSLRIGGQRVPPDALSARLAELSADNPDRPVILEAEGTVSLQQAIDVIDRISGAGLANVSLTRDR